MARRPNTVYVCDSCGAESARWEGRCARCGSWNTLGEVRIPSSGAKSRAWTGSAPAKAVELRSVNTEDHPRLEFGSGEINRVLGGGLVPGSVVLVAGDPGIGKSTLLLAVAADAAREAPALYVTGEESASQVKLRADRLRLVDRGLYLLPATRLADVFTELERLRPSFAVVDSIQTVYADELDSEAGSVSQIRESAARLTQWAKSTGTPVVLTGHVTKSGDIAGPRVLEHVVDVVLQLEGDPVSSFRLLRSVKNRFGSTNEVGVFEMTDRGLRDVPDPSAHLMAQRSGGSIGSLVVPVIEGTRPLLLEVQALTNPSLLPAPRRVASGVDYNRLLLVCAVLTRRAGVSLASQDVIVNVAGGMRVTEPAADLAIALAIISSVRDVEISAGTAAIGEIGLSGEVRQVSQTERRLGEVSRLRLGRCLLPAASSGDKVGKGLEVIGVRSLREAIGAALGRKATRAADPVAAPD